MDIESKFLSIINNNFNIEEQRTNSFVICPKIFYCDLDKDEVNAMKQLYSLAYERAVKETKNKIDSFYNRLNM